MSRGSSNLCVSARDVAVRGAFVPMKMGTEDLGAGIFSQGLYRASSRAGAWWSRPFLLCCTPAALYLSCPAQAPQATSPHCLWAGLLLGRLPPACLTNRPLAPWCLRPSSQVSLGVPFPVLAGEQPPRMDLPVTKDWEPLCLLSLALLCLPAVPESLCSLCVHVKDAVALRVMRC